MFGKKILFAFLFFYREGFLSTVAKSIKRVGASASMSSEHENLEESMRKVCQIKENVRLSFLAKLISQECQKLLL